MPEATGENLIVLEVFGEGKTDIGKESEDSRFADDGVVPIVVHRLCGSPSTMRVKTKRYAHLQGKGLWQKVWFSKRQARYNEGTYGAVFVVDTEGDDKVLSQLTKGRDHELPHFPMAVGAPRPCIEAWLLVDVCEDPEQLPAPRVNRTRNPKTVLSEHGADSQARKNSLAQTLDLNAARQCCLISFRPFATEVETLLRPLFA